MTTNHHRTVDSPAGTTSWSGHRLLARLLTGALFFTLPVVMVGCNILAPALYLIHGPEKVQKAYTLDAKRATVVFVDDRRNQLPRRSLRQVIAEETQRKLLSEKAVETMIDGRAALAATAHDKSTDPMKVTEIARAVQADVIIYATVDQFTLSTDGHSYSPAISMRVKVVDATNEARLWPKEKNGFVLTLTLATKQGFAPQSEADLLKAEAEVAQAAGLGLAQLFVDHEATEAAGKVSPQAEK